MKITQLSVFLENRAGRLADIATTLGDIGVNIRAMSLADTTDFGVLRLIVNDTAKARQVLKDLGFAVRLTEVLAVEIPDRPGELGRLLRIIEQAGLNLEYVYGFVEKNSDNAILIIRFDDLDRAIAAIQAKEIRILDDGQLSSL
ncbi:MAG: ACT domain-containing protein [Desulfobacterales bacterium]